MITSIKFVLRNNNQLSHEKNHIIFLLDCKPISLGIVQLRNCLYQRFIYLMVHLLFPYISRGEDCLLGQYQLHTTDNLYRLLPFLRALRRHVQLSEMPIFHYPF